MRDLLALALSLSPFLLLATSAVAQENEPSGSGPEPSRWETGHSIMVAGETVQYDAVVASATLTDDDGNPAAEQSLPRQWKDTLDDFILRTSGRPAPATQ